MAQRRMFSKQITDTDAFLDMPATAQNLYFHLNMHADDDGFLGNAKTIRRMIGASEDDLKILVAKQFVLMFPDGVAVIRDWHIHNYIQKDRYHSTVYEDDKKKLSLSSTKRYEISPHKKAVESVDQKDAIEMDTPRINDVHETTDTEAKTAKSKSNKKDAEPTIPYKEIIDYLNQKTGAKYKATTKPTQRLIKARWHEGYRLDDFKKVMDNKAFEWQNDSKMWKYMRPATLFGNKFDDYLNANDLDKTRQKPETGGYEELLNGTNTPDIPDIPDDQLPF